MLPLPNPQSSQSVIKSIQRGQLVSTTATVSVAIRAVDMNKAVVIATSRGPYDVGSNTPYTVNITSPIELTFSKVGSQTATTDWQVIEYF